MGSLNGPALFHPHPRATKGKAVFSSDILWRIRKGESKGAKHNTTKENTTCQEAGGLTSKKVVRGF